MRNLNRFETLEFLEVFLKGLLEFGLLEPLQELNASHAVNVRKASQTLYRALISGFTPQVAIGLMSPGLPSIIEPLIINGFEQSNVDFVLKDIIQAYNSHENEEELGKSLKNLFKRYSQIKTETICLECSIKEIQKILKRANAEEATHVILSFQNGHLVQKFISAKLVTVTEAAMPAVYDTLKEVFFDLAKQDKKSPQHIIITKLSDLQFQIVSNHQKILISFAE